MTTVLDTIEKGTLYLEKRGIENARRNMQLLIIHQLNCSMVDLYMQFDRPLEEDELVVLRSNLKRRGEGEPLQHILGSVEFYRREFKSDSRALVPRPETEELVSLILRHPSVSTPRQPVETSEPAQTVEAVESQISAETEAATESESTPPTKSQKDFRILDMGTGTGVLGLSLAAELGGRCQEIVLADVSPDALSLAEENATLLGIARCTTRETNLFAELQDEKFDIIAANLPYIAEADRDQLSPEVLRDPHIALFGGKDGLDILRNFIQQAPSHLNPGGLIALEIGHDQAGDVESMLHQHGFQDIKTHPDLNQIPRFPIASLI